MLKTSATALLAAGFLSGAVTAVSACDWYRKQVTAEAAPPAVEETAEAGATPIDPVLLAKLEAVDGEAAVEK